MSPPRLQAFRRAPPKLFAFSKQVVPPKLKAPPKPKAPTKPTVSSFDGAAPAAQSKVPAPASMPQPPFGVGDIMRKTDAYERLGMLPPGQSARIALAMGSASVNERKMYARVLGELELLQAGAIKPADYFIRVQKHAAALAGGNGNEFMSLVGMSFSEPSSGPQSDLERIAMGA